MVRRLDGERMNVKPCPPYKSRISGKNEIRAGQKSRFKVYFVDIIERQNRERYEWERAVSRESFLESFAQFLAKSGIEGIGFITAFPHITKIFRFNPDYETVLTVRAFNSHDFSPLSLDRGEAFSEFACLAEALIAKDEYALWAEARSVDEYLKRYSAYTEGDVVEPGKLLDYWGS